MLFSSSWQLVHRLSSLTPLTETHVALCECATANPPPLLSSAHTPYYLSPDCAHSRYSKYRCSSLVSTWQTLTTACLVLGDLSRRSFNCSSIGNTVKNLFSPIKVCLTMGVSHNEQRPSFSCLPRHPLQDVQ